MNKAQGREEKAVISVFGFVSCIYILEFPEVSSTYSITYEGICIWGYGEDLLHISLSNEMQGLMRNQSAFIPGWIVCLLLIWLYFIASIQSFVLIEGLHCIALNLSVISFPLLVMLFFAASITTLSLQLIEWYTCKVKWFVSHFPFPAGWTTKIIFFLKHDKPFHLWIPKQVASLYVWAAQHVPAHQSCKSWNSFLLQRY